MVGLVGGAMRWVTRTICLCKDRVELNDLIMRGLPEEKGFVTPT